MSTKTADKLDLDQAWRVHPMVSIRPEPFGALLYHFGTRKLSFLKDRRLLEIVQVLPDFPTARAACEVVGVAENEITQFQIALTTLRNSDMLVEDPR